MFSVQCSVFSRPLSTAELEPTKVAYLFELAEERGRVLGELIQVFLLILVHFQPTRKYCTVHSCFVQNRESSLRLDDGPLQRWGPVERLYCKSPLLCLAS